MTIFRRGPPTWAKIAICDQYLAYYMECRLSSLVSTVEYVDNGKRRFRLQQSTVTPKRTEQNLFVRIGTSEAEVTNNKSKTNNALEVLYY